MTAIYWITGPWQGRLAIVARPRGGEWLENDLQLWRRNGIDIIVSLLTPSENVELALQQERSAAESIGMKFYSFPIPDRNVPDSLWEARDLIEELEQQLAAGNNVAIHCRHGIGRSALIAATLLVQGGVDPDTAFTRVEAARDRPVPDTAEQRAWVEKFAVVEAIL